jgi:hypothetical protein
MHTAGKVLLIIGGVITVLGIIITVIGAASANLDPSEENYYSGNGGDSWIVPGDDFYGVYTSSSVNCESFTMSITDANGDEMFTPTCDYNNEDDLVDDDFQKVGDINWVYTAEGDVLDLGATASKVYIVGEWEAVGDAAGGFLAAAGGILIAICGGVILLIGIILALTLKSKEPVVMMQQGGQMMGGQMMQQPMQQMQQPVQQMQQPVQQMPQETTQQGYEFEQK